MRDETYAKSRMYFEGLLPGNIMSLSNRAYALIVGTSNNDEESRLVDREQLIDIARKRVLEWRELANAEVDYALLIALTEQPELVEVICPDSVYVEPFPMVLRCTQCRVLQLHERYRPKNAADINAVTRNCREAIKRIRKRGGVSYIPCSRDGCNGKMEQLPYISIHRCGQMSSLDMPFSSTKTPNLGFNDSASNFLENFFFDVDSGQQTDFSLQQKCGACKSDYPNAYKRGTPTSNRDRFYPQNFQYLCLKEETGKKVSQIGKLMSQSSDGNLKQEAAEAVVSRLLGLSQSEECRTHLTELLTGGSGDDGNIDDVQNELQTLLAEKQKVVDLLGEDSVALNAINKQITELEKKLELAGGKYSVVNDYIDNSETILAIGQCRRAVEAALLPCDFSKERLRFTDMIAAESNVLRKEEYFRDSEFLKDRYGVSEVVHYKEINVVLASIGYTRDLSRPSDDEPGQSPPTNLVGYSDMVTERLKGKQVIYALPARTEALQLYFDPIKVLKWCISEAGWESPGEEVLSDKTKACAWLLSHCPALTIEPAEVNQVMKQRPLTELAPFYLLHTISHALLKSIKRFTGYDEKSVMEYLIPMDFSLILYVTSVQNYTAGGLLTLFKHYLRQWFDDACNETFNCIFDPLCSDKGAACSGCIQLSMSCETFNTGLSRAYLHGGKIDREQQTTIRNGFWK